MHSVEYKCFMPKVSFHAQLSIIAYFWNNNNSFAIMQLWSVIWGCYGVYSCNVECHLLSSVVLFLVHPVRPPWFKKKCLQGALHRLSLPFLNLHAELFCDLFVIFSCFFSGHSYSVLFGAKLGGFFSHFTHSPPSLEVAWHNHRVMPSAKYILQMLFFLLLLPIS